MLTTMKNKVAEIRRDRRNKRIQRDCKRALALLDAAMENHART